MILRGLVLLCPIPLSSFCSILPFDMKVEGMILGGQVLLCPVPPTRCYRCLPLGLGYRGYDPTGSGTVVPFPSFLLLQHSPVWTFKGRV